MPRHSLSAIAILAGIACGWGASRMAHRTGAAAPAVAVKEAKQPGKFPPAATRYHPLPASAGNPLSTDRYADIAIWATEASATEIADLWNALAAETPPDFTMAEILLTRWTALDPEEAVRVAALSGNGRKAWAAWVRHDPEKALAAARASGRARWMEGVIQGIAEVDPDRAFEIMRTDPALVRFALPAITAEYAKRGKHQQALELKFFYGNTYAPTELALWAKQDPQGAIRWVLAHPYDRSGKSNRTAIFETFLSDYPNQGGELLREIHDPAIRLEFQQLRLKQVQKKGTGAALEFVRNQSDPVTRHALMASLGQQIASSDWATAAGLYREIAESGGSLNYRPVVLRSPGNDTVSIGEFPEAFNFLSKLAERDPQGTFELLLEMDASKNDKQLLDQARGKWLHKNLYSFSEWLAARPPSPERDEWTTNLVRDVTEGDPRFHDFESGVSWSLSIGDFATRRETLDSSLSNWRKKDPAGYAAYVKGPGLPQAVRDSLDRID